MATPHKTIPPYIRRSLLVLIIFLMGISVTRLLVTMHQQEERIEIMEGQIAQLMADTTRLRITDSYLTHESRHTAYSTTPRNDTFRPNAQTTEHRAKHDTITTSTNTILSGAQPQQTVTQHKFTEVHKFDLNTVDSATLVRIPGIAARTASTLIKNRQRYGGFYSPWQLQEFLTWDAAQAYMDEWCTQWFTDDTTRIRRVKVNQATVKELVHHPYISYEQALEIVRYRTRNKHISASKELKMLSTFTDEQLQQLLPYLSLE